MINITAIKDEYSIVEFKITGHANYNDYGRDIVCSSISVLAQTTVIALHDLLGIKIDYQIEDGYLYCRLPNDISIEIRERAKILLDAMLLGIENLQVTYKEYINVVIKEV